MNLGLDADPSLEFSIYPNPTTSQLTIDIQEQIKTITIIDITPIPIINAPSAIIKFIIFMFIYL